MRFHLFVYGTLMRGQANYRGFTAAPCSITPAWLWGKLYDTGCGYPTLEIPPTHHFAAATSDYTADAQRCLDAFTWQQDDFRAQGYDPIWGELMIFDDPQERLPRLDQLEDFKPSEGGLYSRILTVVASAEPELQTCWTYVCGDQTPDVLKQRRIPMWTAINPTS